MTAITLTPYTQGKFTFITGPVTSDKVGILETTLDAAKDSGYKTKDNILVFRHPKDSPKPEYIGTHRVTKVTDSVDEIFEEIRPKTRTVFIAGISLFEEGEIVQLVDALGRSDRNVIATGINLDAQGNPFGHNPGLMALADEVQLSKAYCSTAGCNDTNANRSSDIGGKFLAVCTHHYHYSLCPPVSPTDLGVLVMDVGPMFSGKTTGWERRMNRVLIQGIKPIILKPLKDNRYEEPLGDIFGPGNVTLHNRRVIRAINIRTTNHISEHLARNPEQKYVFIEEVQFIPELYELTFELLPRGYKLHYAGLARGFNRKPFNDVPKLMSLADTIEMHYATCVECGHPAPESQRVKKQNGELVPAHYDDPLELPGGEEKYQARCLAHWELPGEPQNKYTLERYTL